MLNFIFWYIVLAALALLCICYQRYDNIQKGRVVLNENTFTLKAEKDNQILNALGIEPEDVEAPKDILLFLDTLLVVFHPIFWMLMFAGYSYKAIKFVMDKATANEK